MQKRISSGYVIKEIVNSKIKNVYTLVLHTLGKHESGDHYGPAHQSNETFSSKSIFSENAVHKVLSNYTIY